MEDVGSDTLGDLQHPPQRFRAEHRRLTQRHVAQDWDCQGFELFVCSPAVQRELLEPAGQLHIAADCLARLVDAKAAERDPQTIAEKAKGAEDDALLAIGSGENVVRLVDHQHLQANCVHDAQCRLLHLGAIGPRPLRRAEQGQQFGVEPPFAGPAGHLHGQNGVFSVPVSELKVGECWSRKRFMIGPPYAVAELVLDENDLEACSLERDEL